MVLLFIDDQYMIDLFTLQVSEDKLHYNFKEILNEPQPYVGELLQSWTNGFFDRDNKFVKEFQTTFNSSFWELYIFNVFKEYGFEIDFSKPYLDFIVNAPYQVTVEAVISNNAFNAVQEFTRSGYFDDLPRLEEIVRTATIRLTNAIVYKYKEKYKKIYSKEDCVKGKTFILVVAPFEQPYFWEQTSRAITHVLYGVKEFEYKDPNNRVATEVQKCLFEYFIEKDNGSAIPLGFFSDSQIGCCTNEKYISRC